MSTADNKAQAVRAYVILQTSTGIATGLWMGLYAWFLFGQLGLDPLKIGALVAISFAVQLVLEVPSGAWADDGRHRRMLVWSLSCYAVFALCYAWAAVSTASLSYGLACVAEVFFGAASAFFSATLDAWVLEAQRKHTDGSAFRLAIQKTNAFKQRYQGYGNAIGGVFAFVLSRGGLPWLPFILSACLYAAGIVAVVRFRVFDRPKTSLPTDPSRQRPGPGSVSRHMARSLSLVREQRGTTALIVRAGLIYAFILAAQVYWASYMGRVFFLTDAGLAVLPWLPLLAVIWGLGELARGYGGKWQGTGREGLQEPKIVSVEARVAELAASAPTESGSRIEERAHLLAPLLVFAAGVSCQLIAAATPSCWLPFLLGGHILLRFAEGALRARLDAQIDRATGEADRATIKSMAAFVQTMAALLYLVPIGYAMSIDPVTGYTCLLGSVVLAAALLTFRSVPGRRSLWRPSSGTAAYVAIMVSLTVAVGLRRPALWSHLSDESRQARIPTPGSEPQPNAPASVSCSNDAGGKSPCVQKDTFSSLTVGRERKDGAALAAVIVGKSTCEDRGRLLLSAIPIAFGVLAMALLLGFASHYSRILLRTISRLGEAPREELMQEVLEARRLLGADCIALGLRYQEDVVSTAVVGRTVNTLALAGLVERLERGSRASLEMAAVDPDARGFYEGALFPATGETQGVAIAFFDDQDNSMYISPGERELLRSLAEAGLRLAAGRPVTLLDPRSAA